LAPINYNQLLKQLPNIAATLLFFLSLQGEGLAQKSFEVGLKTGLGGNPLKTKPFLTDRNNNSFPMRTNATYSFGTFVSYHIRDVIGIQSGIQWNLQGYRLGSPHNNGLNKLRKIQGDFSIADFQIPVLVVYKFHIPGPKLKTVRLSAGPSLNWISTLLLNPKRNFSYSQRFMASVIFGTERSNLKRLGYGLEYQYANRRIMIIEETNYRRLGETLNTRMSFLSFVLYYDLYEKITDRLNSH
jgi:hypothetical protein